MWPKNTGERDLGPLYVSHVPAGRFVLEEIKRIVGPGASTLSVYKKLVYLGKSFSTLWSVFERVLVVGFKKHEPLVLVDLYEEGQ